MVKEQQRRKDNSTIHATKNSGPSFARSHLNCLFHHQKLFIMTAASSALDEELKHHLASELLIQQRFLTARLLSREVSIHIQNARDALQAFFDLPGNSDKLKATYVVQGTLSKRSRGISSFTVDHFDEGAIVLVGQDKLQGESSLQAVGYCETVHPDLNDLSLSLQRKRSASIHLPCPYSSMLSPYRLPAPRRSRRRISPTSLLCRSPSLQSNDIFSLGSKQIEAKLLVSSTIQM